MERRAQVAREQRAEPHTKPVPTQDRSPTDWQGRLTELLIKYRWATVVPVVLPLSKAFGAYEAARDLYDRALRRNPAQHEERVTDIQRQIQAWRDAGQPGQLCTTRKSWKSVSTRPRAYKSDNYGIEVDLNEILELDTHRRIVRVEPRVNMGQLMRLLLPMGWTLPVLPELEDLTVGGLIMGYGIATSSHKYGLFADTVKACEVVLADGRVVRASPEENADLFYALPSSYGAHGLLTAVELPIIECKPYVKLDYQPVYSLDEACRVFAEASERENPPEFVEGLMFSRDRGVILTGDFADSNEGMINPVDRWYKPWFYKHAESFLDRGSATELIPLIDYYRRYNRSLYFHAELLVPFGNEPLFRYPLGWLMPPKVSFMKLTQTERIREFRDARNVVQDALVPMRLMREGIDLFHEQFDCYPLWLCPHQTYRTKPQGLIAPSPDAGESEMFVDLGAWQVPGYVRRNVPWDGHEAVRGMEKWLRENNGYQCLYAVSEQSREEFWQMFDRKLYDDVRSKYGGQEGFLDVYDKIKQPGS